LSQAGFGEAHLIHGALPPGYHQAADYNAYAQNSLREIFDRGWLQPVRVSSSAGCSATTASLARLAARIVRGCSPPSCVCTYAEAPGKEHNWTLSWQEIRPDAFRGETHW